MKKSMKKVCSLILALVLVIGVLPYAFAATPFTDVPADSWYAPYVEYCYNNGLMNGDSATQFSPNAKMTRAMLVTVLYRTDGSPAVAGSTPFTDVAAGAWFSDPILWAYQNSIVNGTSASTFSPNANITREEMVTIFYRYASAKGADVSAAADLSGYSDSGSISSWAMASFQWAVAEGLITGNSATTLNPRGTASRAECATLINRYVEWMNGNDITVPETTEPATTYPIDEHGYSPEEAMAIGNAYAATLGFTVQELTVEESGFEFPAAYTLEMLEVSGGQGRLNQLSIDVFDCLATQLRARLGSDIDLSNSTVWCYVEWIEKYDCYYVYALYQ